jgi:hypothetical protein
MQNKQYLYSTMNVMVANILLTYGFELVTFTSIVRSDGKESKEFWFNANSPECQVPMTPLDRDRKHWSQADYVSYYATKGSEDLKAIDPEHPILWMRAFSMNRNQLVGIIKNAPRMVEITNGSRSALIAEDASDETKRKIAAML